MEKAKGREGGGLAAFSLTDAAFSTDSFRVWEFKVRSGLGVLGRTLRWAACCLVSRRRGQSNGYCQCDLPGSYLVWGLGTGVLLEQSVPAGLDSNLGR